MKFPVQQSKKSFKKTVLDHLAETHKDVLSIKKDANKEIERRIEERLGDFVHEVQSALDGVIAMRAIFMRKGYFSQEEYNKEKAEMRKKKK